MADPDRPDDRQQVLALGISRDGSQLLARTCGFDKPGNEGRDTAFDVRTGERLWQRTDQRGSDWFPAFSRDGVLGAVQQNASIVVYDVRTGREVAPCTPPDRIVTPFVFSPDNRLLAVNSYTVAREDSRVRTTNRQIRVFELASGKERLSIPTSDYSSVLAFSSDGRFLADGRTAGVSIWSFAAGRVVWQSPDVGSQARALAFSADGKRLASGHENSSILIWDVSAITHNAERNTP